MSPQTDEFFPYKGQIELSVLEEVEDLIEVGDLDIGQDIGIAQPEPGKDGGEHHHFRMGGTADAQQFKIPFLGDLPGDGVQFGENIPGHRIEGLSGGGSDAPNAYPGTGAGRPSVPPGS